MIRAASATLLLLVLGVLAAPPAAAHSDLRSASPAAGSTLSTPPRSVNLEFNEPVRDGFSRVAVTGAQGEVVSAGAATVSGRRVEQAVRVRVAGSYTVAYRVVSADGHVVQGRLDFRYASSTGDAPSAGVSPSSTTPPAGTAAPAPAAAAPAAAPSPAGGDDDARWFLVVVGPALAALVAIGVLLARSPSPGPGAQWSSQGPTEDTGTGLPPAAGGPAGDGAPVAFGAGRAEPTGPEVREPGGD